MMAAYYNEINPYAAKWLRNLIKAGHIAPGDVDERSIEDVRPEDLRGYTQCHFFAGIGVWSHALRSAGWSDDRPVWTGSCPCQPFSSAGKGAGFTDERHLWPAWFHLIMFCRPPVVFGEQVASKDGLGWLDLVLADLEDARYACGGFDLCAAGVGSPHIRQRLYWVADASESGRQPRGRSGGAGNGGDEAWIEPGRLCDVGGLADAKSKRQRADQFGRDCCDGFLMAGSRSGGDHEHDSATCGMADATGGRDFAGFARTNIRGLQAGDGGHQGHTTAGPTNGFWRDADWLGCRDGKWRPVEPGTFPLAHGAPGRVGRLQAYGNAIVGPLAQTFIEAYRDIRDTIVEDDW